ncbi:unnamed protein product [Pleuronectes platessa]|uniref:Uncharacterized protein n=1 Tax=Pleuronectes platessa TaxID=8262 RepID=A0A9N7TYJ7_PLEPL|nr:unnamed protein product [Pleuronectes platessa]
MTPKKVEICEEAQCREWRVAFHRNAAQLFFVLAPDALDGSKTTPAVVESPRRSLEKKRSWGHGERREEQDERSNFTQRGLLRLSPGSTPLEGSVAMSQMVYGRS